MEWISSYWIILVIAGLCIGMYFFGYGCCAQGKHGKEGCDEDKPHSCEPDNEGKAEKKDHGCCG